LVPQRAFQTARVLGQVLLVGPSYRAEHNAYPIEILHVTQLAKDAVIEIEGQVEISLAAILKLDINSTAITFQ